MITGGNGFGTNAQYPFNVFIHLPVWENSKSFGFNAYLFLIDGYCNIAAYYCRIMPYPAITKFLIAEFPKSDLSHQARFGFFLEDYTSGILTPTKSKNWTYNN